MPQTKDKLIEATKRLAKMIEAARKTKEEIRKEKEESQRS